jgi:hypothetical protein
VIGMLLDFNPFTEQITVEYFVGREYQLSQFRSDLGGLKAKLPNHQYVAGLHGTGKTSFLAKLADIARENQFLAAIPTLDAESLVWGQLSTILEKIIIELQTLSKNEAILSDWRKGKASQYFQHPRTDEVKSDRLRQDFETIEGFMKEAGIPGAVVCIDEGQRINGRTMSALKNSLQYIRGYMIILSLRLITDSPGGAVALGRDLLDTKASNDAEGDIGASRFYVTGIPIGPFDTEQEAAQCIKRRLVDHVVQFEDEVVNRVVRISGRIPKNIVSLSNSVYNDAKITDSRLVNVAELNQTFRAKYNKETVDAQTLLANATEATRSAVRSLLELRQSATAKAIATHLYPSAKPETIAYLIDGIRGDLERFCSSTSSCLKVEDHYAIFDPVYAYALELALGIV